MYKSISTIVLLMCTLNSGFGLYFHIAENERKCFIKDVPDETTVIVKFRVELYDSHSNDFLSSPNVGVRVEVHDSDDKMVVSPVFSSEGRISFTSRTYGEHKICIYCNHTAWFRGRQLRVHLDIQAGVQAILTANFTQALYTLHKQLKFSEQLEAMSSILEQFINQANQINNEQDYEYLRYDQFRRTCESINSRVLWWALAQTIVLVVMGYLYKTKVESGPFNTKLDNTRPINVLNKTWKKMHYPTETGTIMLIVRLMAMYEQSKNKQEFLKTLESFQSITVNTDQKTCLLDENIESQIEELFEAFRNAFNTEQIALFTSSDVFKTLMALILANNQGIAIIPLADWMAMLSDLPLDEKAKIELDEYIDNLEINVVN